MTTFHPTEAELLERGFTEYEEKMFSYDVCQWISVFCNSKTGGLFLSDEEENTSIRFYPTSFEDIDAIIRIFTPKD